MYSGQSQGLRTICRSFLVFCQQLVRHTTWIRAYVRGQVHPFQFSASKGIVLKRTPLMYFVLPILREVFSVSTALRLTMQIRTLTVKFRCGLFLFVQEDKKSESLFWIVLEYHSIQAAARHCVISISLWCSSEKETTHYTTGTLEPGGLLATDISLIFVCFLHILTFRTRLVSLLWQPSAGIVLPGILCFMIKTINLMTPCCVYGVKTQTLNLQTVVSKP